MPRKLFVANWKMNKSFSESIAFAQKHTHELNQLCNEHKQLVLCPSYPALYSIAQLVKDTSVAIGAQNCSAHDAGAYTGQVSAESLKQAGCSYCIVGHSEQRRYCHLTNQEVAQKVSQLINQSIIPIICIGESEQEYTDKKTFDVLDSQLRLLIPLLRDVPCVIAYEPVWAIGTGTIPAPDYLKKIFSWLKAMPLPNSQLLYGGSVDEKNGTQLLQIEGIDGFLIGGASLDFQKLQKLVSLS